MKKTVHSSAKERRALAERIVRESGDAAPKGVALVDFREPTRDELAHAETLVERARLALGANAKRRTERDRALA